MTFDAILFLATAVMALALKPGPGMMMVMSRTITQGAGAGLTCLLGYLIIGFAYLLFVFVSFNIPGLDMIFISILMKSVAAVYLIWMGVQGLKEAHLVYDVEGLKTHSFFDNLSSAMVLSISNPLVVVFYAGILPTLVDVNLMTFDDMSIIIMVVLAVEGIIPILYCAPLALFRKKIPKNFLKGMRILSSIMIVLIGIYIGYTALPAKDILFVF